MNSPNEKYHENEDPIVNPKKSIIVKSKSELNSDIFKKSDDEKIIENDKIMMNKFESDIEKAMISIQENSKGSFSMAIKNSIITAGTRIYDYRTNQFITVLDAIKTEIIDPYSCVYQKNDETKISFQEATGQELFITCPGPVSLYDALMSGIYDENTRTFLIGDRTLSLAQCLHARIINDAFPEVFLSQSNTYVTVADAIRSGFIDERNSTIRVSKRELSLLEAVRMGIIVEESPLISLTIVEAVIQKVYLPHSNIVIDPITGVSIDIHEAIDCGLITLDGAVIHEYPNRTLSLKRLNELGLVDFDKGILLIEDSNGRCGISIEDAVSNGTLSNDVNKTITIKTPYNFQTALENDLYVPEIGKFIDPRHPDKYYSLLPAIQNNILNMNSILVCDHKSGEIYNLNNAIKNGLILPNEAKVIHNDKNDSITFDMAVKINLIINRPMTISKAIEIGISDGIKFRDPIYTDGNLLTLDEAVECNLIHVLSTTAREVTNLDLLNNKEMVKLTACALLDPNDGNIINIHNGGNLISKDINSSYPVDQIAKYAEKLVENYDENEKAYSLSSNLFLNEIYEKIENIYQPSKNELLISLYEKQADEFANCLDNAVQWLQKLRMQLKNQSQMCESTVEINNIIKDHKVLTSDVLSNINTINGLRARIENLAEIFHSGTAENDNDRELLDLLMSQKDDLQKKANDLSNIYTSIMKECEQRQKDLDKGADELLKLNNELCAFADWLESTRSKLDSNNSKSCTRELVVQQKALSEEVTAHQADLRFVNISGQQYLSTCLRYNTTLENFILAQHPGVRSSMILTNEIKTYTNMKERLRASNDAYNRLTSDCSTLEQSFHDTCNQQEKLSNTLNKIKHNISNNKSEVEILLKKNDSSLNQLEKDIGKSLVLAGELLNTQTLLDNAKLESKILQPIPGVAYITEIEAKEDELNDLKSKLSVFTENARISLITSQSERDAQIVLNTWLKDCETKLSNKNMNNIPLNLEKLTQCVHNIALLKLDIKDHESSFNKLKTANPESTTILSHYTSIRESTASMHTELNDILVRYSKAKDAHSRLNDWCHDSMNHLHHDGDVKSSVHKEKVKEIATNIESKCAQLKCLKEDTIYLVEHPNTIEVKELKDIITNLDNNYSELSANLIKTQEHLSSQEELHLKFDILKHSISEWLSKHEVILTEIEVIAVSNDAIIKQINFLKPIIEKYDKYSNDLTEFNSLANSLNIKPSPKKPRKSPSRLSSVNRQLSNDNTSFTETNIFDEKDLEQEMVQLLNNRYDSIGEILVSRQACLDSTLESSMFIYDLLHSTRTWVKCEEKKLEDMIHESESVLVNCYEKDIEAITDKHKKRHEAMIADENNLVFLDKKMSTLLEANDSNAEGAKDFRKSMRQLDDHWMLLKQLSIDQIKSLTRRLKDQRLIVSQHSQLTDWLASKEKMMVVLSAAMIIEPSILQNQIDQVQLLKEEYLLQQPLYELYVQSSLNLIDNQQYSDLQLAINVENVSRCWDNLEKRLNDRDQILNKTYKSCNRYYELLQSLSEWLPTIEESLQSIPEIEASSIKQINSLKNVYQNIETELQDHKPQIEECYALTKELCMPMKDTVSQNELKKKISCIDLPYQNAVKLCAEGLKHIQAASHDNVKFYENFASHENWLNHLEDQLSDSTLISADNDNLRIQAREHEIIIKSANSQAAEIDSWLSKGKSLSDKSSDEDNLKNNIDNFSKKWVDLQSTIEQKSIKLKLSQENCTDFNQSANSLNGWLKLNESQYDEAHNVPKSLDCLSLERKIQEIDSSQAEIESKQHEVTVLKDKASTLINSTDCDHDDINEQVKSIVDSFKCLTNNVVNQSEHYEATLQKVSEYEDCLCDINKLINNIESQISEEKSADNIKSLEHDIELLPTRLNYLCEFAHNLIGDTTDQCIDSTTDQSVIINDCVQNCITRVDNVIEDVQKLLANVDRSKKLDCKIQEDIQCAEHDFTTTDSEINELPCIAYDRDILEQQTIQVQAYQNKLLERDIQIDEIENQIDQIIESCDISEEKQALYAKSLSQLKTHSILMDEVIRNRSQDIADRSIHLNTFHCDADSIIFDLNELKINLDQYSQPETDIDHIHHQQNELKSFKRCSIDPALERLNTITNEGNILLAKGIKENADVKQLENIMDTLSRDSTLLNQELTNRTSDLESSLLTSGEYNASLATLNHWLNETELLIENQKSPSIELKVAKAQVQEQKFVRHLMDDRATAVEHVVNMGKQLADDANIAKLSKRWNVLLSKVDERDSSLQITLQSSRDFTAHVDPFSEWLISAEKQQQNMQLPVAESSVVKSAISKQNELLSTIMDKKSDLDAIFHIGQQLSKLGKECDKQAIKNKLNGIENRFKELEEISTHQVKALHEAEPLCSQFNAAEKELSKLINDIISIDSNSSSGDASSPEEKLIAFKKILNQCEPHFETLKATGALLKPLTCDDISVDSTINKYKQQMDDFKSTLDLKTEHQNQMKKRSSELLEDLEDINQWFNDVQLSFENSPFIDTNQKALAVALSEQKLLNEDIIKQKTKARDLIAAGKRLRRDSTTSIESDVGISEQSDLLKSATDKVSKLSADRLSLLEQALPLSKHLEDVNELLDTWFNDISVVLEEIDLSDNCSSLEQMKSLQELLNIQKQNVFDQRPAIDRLNKAGTGLIKLITADSLIHPNLVEQVNAKTVLEDHLEDVNQRYETIRDIIRSNCSAVSDCIQQNADLSDQIEHMLETLAQTFDSVEKIEPISPHINKLRDQISDNNIIEEDMQQRKPLYKSIVKQASELVHTNNEDSEDGLFNDVQHKVDEMTELFNSIDESTASRKNNLKLTSEIADIFWDDLSATTNTLSAIRNTLIEEEQPSVESSYIYYQQSTLETIKEEIEEVDIDVNRVSETGEKLLDLIGNSERPEVQKTLDDMHLDLVNVISNANEREKKLDEARKKAENFRDELSSMLSWLQSAENQLNNLSKIGSNAEKVKSQICELDELKSNIHPRHEHIALLNHSGQTLIRDQPEDCSRVAIIVQRPLLDVNRRWNQLLDGVITRKGKLQHALLSLGQLDTAIEELLTWLQSTQQTLAEFELIPLGDQRALEIDLAKLHILQNDMLAHDVGREAARRAANNDDNNDGSSTKLDILDRKWVKVNEKANDLQKSLDLALKGANDYLHELDEAMTSAYDYESQLDGSTPVGGLPDTAREQLQRFMVLYDEIMNYDQIVVSIIDRGKELLSLNLRSNDRGRGINHDIEQLRILWQKIMLRSQEKRNKLEDALNQADGFNDNLNQFVGWLTNMEKELSNTEPGSRIVDNIEQQIINHTNLQKSIVNERVQMNNLQERAALLKYFSQKQDLILIRNLVVNVEQRWQKLLSKVAQRSRRLQNCYQEAKQFSKLHDSMLMWLHDNQCEVVDNIHIASEPTNIRQQILKHREFQRRLGAKQPALDNVNKIGRHLKDRCRKSDIEPIQAMLNQVKTEWNDICTKSVDRQRKLEEALLFSGQLADAIQALLDWLYGAELQLTGDDSDGGGILLSGDLDTVNNLIEQYKNFEVEFEKRRSNLETVRKVADDMNSPTDDSKISSNRVGLQSQLIDLSTKWDRVEHLASARKSALDAALTEAEEFDHRTHSLLEWLAGAERLLRYQGAPPDDKLQIEQQLLEHQNFQSDLEIQKSLLNTALNLGSDILSRCHPDAITTVKHWITILQSRWDQVMGWSDQRQAKLNETLESLHKHDELLKDMIVWITDVESGLLKQQNSAIPENLPIIEQLLNDHQTLESDIQSRQADVDSLTKSGKRTSENSTSALVAGQVGALKRHKKIISSRYSQKKETPITKSDVVYKNPKLNTLINKWSKIWLMSLDRKQRLQDAMDNVIEIERLRNFNYEDWRVKYMRWMNGNKIRVMDFFRRLDRDHDGKISRKEFIDGILVSSRCANWRKTEFPSSVLEMEAVADLFDRQGVIDYKEFITSLRPDKISNERLANEPAPDADRIQDEVKRQASKCTCVKQYKIHKIGEGKYRFGESQKLRLVRILRSTVMVRVGGGWVALDEFLIKNDPCRAESQRNKQVLSIKSRLLALQKAKGRTNVELREQFVLAQGVAQSMTPFKSKMSGSRSTSATSWSAGGYTSSSAASGPITKIREKTINTAPWRQNTSPIKSSNLQNNADSKIPRSTNQGSVTAPRAASRSETGDTVDKGDLYTIMKTETKTLAGRPSTTVTFQTHSTRTVTTPTAAGSRIPGQASFRGRKSGRLPKPS